MLSAKSFEIINYQFSIINSKAKVLMYSLNPLTARLEYLPCSFDDRSGFARLLRSRGYAARGTSGHYWNALWVTPIHASYIR